MRRKIRQVKRVGQCNCVSIAEVWSMIKRMGGNRREWEFTVLEAEVVSMVQTRINLKLW